MHLSRIAGGRHGQKHGSWTIELWSSRMSRRHRAKRTGDT
jgi:hypothetical protein